MFERQFVHIIKVVCGLQCDPGPLLSFQHILIHNLISVLNIISHNNELIHKRGKRLFVGDFFAAPKSPLNWTWLKLNCIIPQIVLARGK